MKRKPLWTGQDLKDKVLYTYYEAGFGDVLIVLSLYATLTSKCKKLYLNPRKSFAGLFRENPYGARNNGTFRFRKRYLF